MPGRRRAVADLRRRGGDHRSQRALPRRRRPDRRARVPDRRRPRARRPPTRRRAAAGPGTPTEPVDPPMRARRRRRLPDGRGAPGAGARGHARRRARAPRRPRGAAPARTTTTPTTARAAAMQRRERELLARFRAARAGTDEPVSESDAWRRRPTGRSSPSSSCCSCSRSFLAAAETAFTRMSRIRAHRARGGGRQAARAGWREMLERPGADAQRRAARWSSSSQLTSATLLGVLLEGVVGSARRRHRHRARRSSCSS